MCFCYWQALFFYALLEVKFLPVLVYVIIVNYLTILLMDKKHGKVFFVIGIILSLLPLLFYKYSYFIINDVLALKGMMQEPLLFPIGISFFSFQAISYTIDYYRGKETVKPSFLESALFVSFFPCVLSGPIERARNMMPQFRSLQKFDLKIFVNGIQLFIWGLFQKNVVAEGLKWYVDSVYHGFNSLSGSTIVLGILLYSIQIYCDFCGYSNMAVGIGRMLGFKIMRNFSFPYFSTSLKDFWRKWHISLTSWFTEYIYISLGGNRVRKVRWILNILIVFLVSGIWHGAAWTFVFWGLMHGIIQVLERFGGLDKGSNNKIVNVLRGVFLFVIVSIAWVFFRSPNLDTAFSILGSCINHPFGIPSYFTASIFFFMMLSFAIFIVFDVLMNKGRIGVMEYDENPLKWKNLLSSAFLILCIELMGKTGDAFVYFQF